MKQLVAILSIVGFLFGALLGLPLGVGIWLPDTINAPRKIVAEQTLASGYQFRVVQYWNRIDFYTTELRVASPDGRNQVHILDGDDNKSWRLPLVIDESNRTATVTLSGGRSRKVEW